MVDGGPIHRSKDSIGHIGWPGNLQEVAAGAVSRRRISHEKKSGFRNRDSTKLKWPLRADKETQQFACKLASEFWIEAFLVEG
jgi:hypothetical protein